MRHSTAIIDTKTSTVQTALRQCKQQYNHLHQSDSVIHRCKSLVVGMHFSQQLHMFDSVSLLHITFKIVIVTQNSSSSTTAAYDLTIQFVSNFTFVNLYPVRRQK